MGKNEGKDTTGGQGYEGILAAAYFTNPLTIFCPFLDLLPEFFAPKADYCSSVTINLLYRGGDG